MKASLNWVKKYVDIENLTPEEIASRMTFAGVEVEDIIHLARGTNLVIGEILTCENHPDSDHLHILNVDEGPKHGVHQIVCGAPNARKGLKVIVAREGAVLPEVTIVKSTIRGVDSDGMCCSLLELGVDKKYLSEKQVSGIEELPEDAPVGEENVLGYLGLDDTILDLSLLANRPDMYAIANIAREIGCLYGKEAKIPEPTKRETKKIDFEVGSTTEKCPQFAIQVVKGIKTKESPKWMKEALLAEGIRSINNIVDIGNYIMLLTGQPLNMYDLDKLPKASLVVRDDLEGDYVAMDEQTYKLAKGDLVVTSDGRPMCLAGVMTAKECTIDENTVNVAVESAVFDYARIRHTVNRIGLSSDSSLRFIKGINRDQAEYVLALTADLLADLAEAKEIYEVKNYDTVKHERKVIKTSLGYINGRLGTSFDLETVVKTLKDDHMDVVVEGETMIVTVPNYRIDMDGQADIAEEVIRILGYSNVHSILPTTELQLTGLTPKQVAKRSIRRHLRSIGLDEVLTYTLVDEKKANSFKYLEKGEPFKLSNPMTVERGFVRMSMLPSLLESASYNVDRQNKDLAFFEISDIDTPSHRGSHLGAVLVGNKPLQGSLRKTPYTFYDAKGIVEAIMQILGLNKNRYQIVAWTLGGEDFHPGKSAEIRMGKQLLGVMGELHPNALKAAGLKSAIALELDMDALLNLKTSAPKASVPPKFPSVSRDLALVIDRKVTYEEIAREVNKADALIKGVEVFDVYEGANIGEGKKSIAITLTIRSDEKTLKEEEVSSSVNKAISTLKVKFGADIRS
ncbi:MAG: phenylalanine--tRNA ligase subunit beta [Bacilli bacterium]|nr:phenylalanine--tRNA ligase subunit beta [Bacilli bacterium]